MENVVETDGLSKVYGWAGAVSNIALRLPTGSIYGFVGPNGAGKTTTIRMLLGLIVIELAGMIAAPPIGPGATWMIYIPSVTPYAAFSHSDVRVDAHWVGLTGAVVCFVLMIVHLFCREVG